jgi:deoxyribose-phosphate aldolase
MMYAKQMRIEFQYTDESSSNQEALATLKEIEQFSFVKKLSVLPPYVKYLNGKISEQNRIDIGCIIDFPFGILSTENKLDIIKRSIQDGANSIEMVMPSFLINNRQNAKIKQDIEKCYDLCAEHAVNLHYILEYRIYNYSCLSRLVKFLLGFNLNDIYISTGYRLDDIYDHIIAMRMIIKENENANIICNANIYNKEHLEILESSNLSHFRVNSVNVLTMIREKYQI